MRVNKIIKPVGNSLIGWLGGKTRLRPTIINSMPPHFCYVEVFAGSATVFFGKPGSMSKTEIINDVHKDLVHLMMVISGTCFDEEVREEFIRYVRNMPASRVSHHTWRHMEEDEINSLTLAQRAYRFYYCVKKGFSCTPKGGYESSPFSLNRYNMSTDFEVFAARFRERNAQIECLNFPDLIAKYNNPRADVFFFMDPPYWIANDTNYYEFVFGEEEHLKLKNLCDEIDNNKNKFLITYDDVPEIINLYKDYFIYRTDPIVYKAQQMEEESESKKTELFISNYDIAEMILDKNTRSSRDIFDEEEELEMNRIEFPDCIGLELIS